MQHGCHGRDCTLGERLQSLEQTVQFLAAVLTMRARTDQETGRLVAIARGQYAPPTPASLNAPR
jgi:hypothetical protein